MVLYDKAGDRVETDYDIVESEPDDQFASTLLQQKSKPLKYKYKVPNAVDN